MPRKSKRSIAASANIKNRTQISKTKVGQNTTDGKQINR